MGFSVLQSLARPEPLGWGAGDRILEEPQSWSVAAVVEVFAAAGVELAAEAFVVARALACLGLPLLSALSGIASVLADRQGCLPSCFEMNLAGLELQTGLASAAEEFLLLHFAVCLRSAESMDFCAASSPALLETELLTSSLAL